MELGREGGSEEGEGGKPNGGVRERGRREKGRKGSEHRGKRGEGCKDTLRRERDVNCGMSGGIYVRLINVNGLTVGKLQELEEKFLEEGGDYNIVCLTETHEKWERFQMLEGIESYTEVRGLVGEEGEKEKGDLEWWG